jgi:hypothetical protein
MHGEQFFLAVPQQCAPSRVDIHDSTVGFCNENCIRHMNKKILQLPRTLLEFVEPALTLIQFKSQRLAGVGSVSNLVQTRIHGTVSVASDGIHLCNLPHLKCHIGK